MENASNALIMAGGVLIGILIISLAVYLFTDFGSTSAQIHQEQTQQQISEFNTKFTVYEGRKDLTIYDIVTIAGYALENNEHYSENQEEYAISVIITGNGTTDVLKNIKNNYNGLIADEQKNQSYTYTCKQIQYHENGRVKSIVFNRN